MQCPNCSSVNRDGAKFCDECGFPLGGALARAAANVPVSSFSESGQSPQISDESAERSGAVEPEDELTQRDQLPEDEAEAASPKDGEEALDSEEPEPAAEDPSEGVDAGGEDLPGESDSEMHASDTERTFAPGEGGESAETERKGTRSEKDAVDLTGTIGDLSSDVTRKFSEDDFAGFTTPSDDGYSFSATYAGEAGGPQGGREAGYTMKMPRVEGEAGPSEQKHDFIASSTVPKKSHAKTVGIVLLIVAVIAAIVAATYFTGVWGGKAIPDVTNMTETDARAVLEEAGFSVRASQVKSDDTEGLVLIMDPASGTRAPEKSEVVIHIATARLIPEIVGMNAEEAKAALHEAGYDIVTQENVKAEGDEGIVLAVEPEVGSRAKSTTEVILRVSEAFRVPDVSGMYWDQALAAVRDAGFEPQIVYVNTEYYPEGSIIGTTPEAGAVASEGSYVSINIAQSRATVLTSLTQSLLVPGGTVTINGYNYTIDSLSAVSYVGNDTVAFTITGRPFVSLLGEVIHASPQTVNGQVVWSPSNEVVSIT